MTSTGRPAARRAGALGARPAQGIPEATVARLPLYLRALTALADEGVPTVSSEELAAAAGVNSAKLRKDFSYLGSYGTRGVGYDVEYLVYQISRELGLTQDWPVVIVGIGNLGARAGQLRRLRLPRLPGRRAARRRPRAWSASRSPGIAGRSTSTSSRRSSTSNGVVDRRHRHPGRRRPAGLRPAGRRRRHHHPELRARPCSSVPDGVDVRKVDLSIELQILAFHEQRKAGEEPLTAEAGGRRRRSGPRRA